MKNKQVVRVVAGKYRGRNLECVSNDVTRPTTDANKEMVFNTLGQFFDGGVALDLLVEPDHLELKPYLEVCQAHILVKLTQIHSKY